MPTSRKTFPHPVSVRGRVCEAPGAEPAGGQASLGPLPAIWPPPVVGEGAWAPEGPRRGPEARDIVV